MKFRAIFLKTRYDVANNCLIKVQIREFFCTHVTHITVIMFCTTGFGSTKAIFNQTHIPFQILRFLAQNHLTLLKDKFLFAKLKAQIILLL